MMMTLLRIWNWIWKSWPLLCILVLGYSHYSLIVSLRFDEKGVNDAIALTSQLSGGLLVLYSIDSTIGILNGTSLLKDFKTYVSEFPLIRRNVVAQISGAATISVTGKAAAIGKGMPKSFEEQIVYLQEQINALRHDTSISIEELQTSLEEKEGKLNERIDSTEESVKTIEKKVTDVSLGGVKVQLLGVMLLIYGAVTAYVT